MMKIVNSKKTLTKEYLKEMDKKVPLIPVYFDPIFKGVFLWELLFLYQFYLYLLF